MSHIIDRRLNGKGKSSVNRKRFMDRYKKQIKESVDDALRRGNITDDGSIDISIPKRDISEPVFHHGKGGVNDMIHPGNKDFMTGDEFKRPDGGGGSGGAGEGEASNEGEGEDEFTFTLTQEEYLDIVFSDCELPNLIKRTLAGSDSFKRKNAGYQSDGSPEKLAITPTCQKALERRIALTAAKKRHLNELKEELDNLPEGEDEEKRLKIEEEIKELEERIKAVPWMDDLDTVFRSSVEEPVPTSKAVMFCVMDVSGSMTQDMKDIAKRYYLLLNLFLKRNYDKSEVVFISHHTTAKECDEQEFFYGRETGGTIVSSALELMQDIIKDRYPSNEWNIYGAQVSDGDNWGDDSLECVNLLREILPELQYYSYIEIDSRGQRQALWESYLQLQEEFPETFAQKIVQSAADIFPVFHELFKKTGIQFAEPVSPNQAATNFLKQQKGPSGP